MIRSLFFALLVFVFAGNAQAEPLIMSAPEAASAVANDALILIDIRSPAEWVETGVAQGAPRERTESAQGAHGNLRKMKFVIFLKIHVPAGSTEIGEK